MPRGPISTEATAQNSDPYNIALKFPRERQDDLPFADVSMAHTLIRCLFRPVAAALSMLACSSSASLSYFTIHWLHCTNGAEGKA